MDKDQILNEMAMFLERHVPPAPWGVAVSGGSDSLALALFLREFSHDLQAIVIDHGLRPESADEAIIACQNLAVHHINVRCAQVVWHALPKTRIQEQARKARHQVFKEAVKYWKIQSFFLGHTLDDQIETFFSRLIHASGMRGLCGMAEVQFLSEIPAPLYRPLLATPKGVLQSFLKNQGISWLSDPSNANPYFERVRLRQFIAKGKDIPWNKVSLSLHKLKGELDALDAFCASWAQRCPGFPFNVLKEDLLDATLGRTRLEYLLRCLKINQVRSRSIQMLQKRLSEGQTSTLGSFRFNCIGEEIVISPIFRKAKAEKEQPFEVRWISPGERDLTIP